MVTVTLGPSFGRILTATEVGLVEAVVAFGLLAALQSLGGRRDALAEVAFLIKSPPSLMYFRGQFIGDTMRRDQISEGEIEAALWREGVGSLDLVEAVVLESGGTFAIIQKEQCGDGAALRELTGNR